MPRFIELFKPFIKYLPDIKKPERITFNEKLVWTAIALILYLVMSEVPLYGVGKGGAQDPLGALRVIFASSRGTLMELGIGPIVTGGLILQILSGSKMIDVDMTNPEDRSLFTGASKILAVLMTIFEALAYILGGAYGPLKVQTQIAILSQLVAAGLILILLDEMLQKGWGLGSGISLFIAAGVAQRIWWDMVAPMGPMQDGKFLGALIAFTQSLQLGEGFKALYRGGGLPDMIGLLTTVAVVIIVIYVNGLKVSVPVSYAKYRGFRGTFPIKFLYTSNIPVIFAAALMGNIYFITQILWQRYNQTNTNFWLNLLGTYKTTEGHIEPTGGLIYYLAPPRSLTGLLGDPLRAAVYAGLFILMCIFFSVTWVEVGGMDSKTVAKQLIDSGMQIEGFRRSSLPIQQLLSRYIPTVTVLGGATVGAIAASADFLGAFGSGTGILLTVGIIEQYYQILVKERMSEMFPALRGFLGE
ncbi:preprotein translocase subunit SecY [Candidatus Bathyarchaeota archaeon]|nr:preprotein translocase subunit SecY [Candidatus Bathyarchaeota archaeon]